MSGVSSLRYLKPYLKSKKYGIRKTQICHYSILIDNARLNIGHTPVKIPGGYPAVGIAATFHHRSHVNYYIIHQNLENCNSFRKIYRQNICRYSRRYSNIFCAFRTMICPTSQILIISVFFSHHVHIFSL